MLQWGPWHSGGGSVSETPQASSTVHRCGQEQQVQQWGGAGDAHPQKPKEMGATGGLCCGMGQGERHPRAPALLEGSWGGAWRGFGPNLSRINSK